MEGIDAITLALALDILALKAVAVFPDGNTLAVRFS
jgi:hypothetical protein